MRRLNWPALVQDAFEANAERNPGKTALVCGDRRLSYGEIDAMANRLANALIGAGLERGARAAVWSKNSVEAVVSIYAILKAGGVFVPVNQSAKPAKVGYILANCGASILIANGRLAGAAVVEALVERAPSLRAVVITDAAETDAPAPRPVLSFDRLLRDWPDARPPRRNIDLDLAAIIYTSGSTGEPKGVVCGHDNMVFAAGSIVSYIGNREDDIVIGVLPLSFDYGLYQLLMTFTFGGTLVLEDSFAFPAAILARIERERVTGFPGVPAVFAMMRNMDLSAWDLSSLRYMTNTAAALPVSHIEDLRRKFPGVTLFSMYGLTETKRTLYLPPDQLDARPGSVGIAIPGTEVWLENEDGSRPAPGEPGELVIRGRHVMRGYWGDAELTARRYRPGPLPGERICYSGDLFRADSEGYLYFVARKDDIIKSRGEKVAPKEVEAVLYSLPGVLEAAVTGVPDEVFGQAVKAYIVRAGDDLTEARVLAHCRAHLENFMVPKYVEFRDSLPRTSSGKVAKTELAACAASPA